MWNWECFTPHPPIIVPEVGRGREEDARKTREGMEMLRRLTASAPPEVLLLLSPHAPFSGGITFTLAEEYSGSFSQFGAGLPVLSYPGNPEKGKKLAETLASSFPVSAVRKPRASLDHASLVPLYFLQDLVPPPALIVANPIGLTTGQALSLGRDLASMNDSSSWALLASGDLSHRVTPEAPAGYSPLGAVFDRAVVEALKSNDSAPLFSLDDRQIEEAGECGLRSLLAFLGLGERRDVRFLSYEAPFGVGYGTAFAALDASPALARESITEWVLSGKRLPENRLAFYRSFSEMREERACFVSLKMRGELRGCIGTLAPTRPSLADEIAENAISSASRDPRFPPLSREELGDISISVDVLSSPERVDSPGSLDPRKYGVIVEKGFSRGVLLPDLEGVDSVEQQLSIAARKAGLGSLDGISIFRFTVRRVREAGE